MRIEKLALATSLVLALSAPLSVAQAQSISTYDCRLAPTDEQLDVQLDPASGIGAYITKTGERSLVPDGEGGWTNVDGSVRFAPSSDTPTLQYQDKPRGCTVTATQAVEASQSTVGEATPDASGGGAAVNVTGRSLGGRVRSGPGTDFDPVGNLAQDDAVELLENTGVMLDGFAWFEIRYGDGQSGFQWGGVLCSDGDAVDGLTGACQ